MSFLKGIFSSSESSRKIVDLEVKDVIVSLQDTLQLDCFRNSQPEGFYLDCIPAFLEVSRKELQQELVIRLNTIRLAIKHSSLSTLSDLKSMITEQVINQKGIFRSLIQLWVCYCRCKIYMMTSNDQVNLTRQIQKFIHKEINLFVQYLWIVTLSIFRQAFGRYVATTHTKIGIDEQFQLVEAVKLSLTDTQHFQQLYEDVAPKLLGRRHFFSAEDFQQTQKQLSNSFDTHCANFFAKSMQILKEFYAQSSMSVKSKKLLQLRYCITEEIKFYTSSEAPEAQTQDFLSNIYVYLIKSCKKNILGSCFYMELILCPPQVDITDDISVYEALKAKIVQLYDPVLQKIFRAVKSYGSFVFQK